MALVLTIYTVFILWTAGLPDWIVAYATGVAQLGIWVTLASLIPFSALWISLKRQFFAEMPVTTTRAHWGLTLKSNHWNKMLCGNCYAKHCSPCSKSIQVLSQFLD